MFKAIEKVSAAEQVVETIKTAIDSGELIAGTKLPPERKLAEDLGVSRPVLREALVSLSAYGLISMRQGEGNFVVDQLPEAIFSLLGLGSSLNEHNYKNFYEYRKMIELSLAEEIIANAKEDDIQKLIDINEKMNYSLLVSVEELVQLECDFHEKVISLCENELIIKLYSIVIKFINVSCLYLLQSDKVREEAYLSHQEIIRDIQERDVLAYRFHTRRSIENTSRNLGEIFKGKK